MTDSAVPGRGSPLGWLTPLVGRETELAAVALLLQRNRLVTLTGAGGVGKTRLALELGNRWPGPDADMRVVVELAMLEPSDGEARSLEPVAGAIWRALHSAVPGATTSGAPIEDVAHHYGDGRALLVLDNCEHLPGVAAISELLLRRCPQLRILATSRRALVLPGEVVSQVPPMSLPADADDVLGAVCESEAGRLFIERAQRSLPSFALTRDTASAVAEICHRLDGLALAIELAAARVAILSPVQILDGLDDRFALLAAGPASPLGRHRTLRASLEWSYELIEEDAQALLRFMSAAPDWSLDAIKAIAPRHQAVLDTLVRLLDAGLLVTVDESERRRYRLLETVRSYARERLLAAGEDRAVRRAHMGHFRLLAADASSLLGDDTGRRQLESESQNLYAALEFAVTEQPALALQMTADLRHWLPVSGRTAEALALCARVLEASSSAADTAARCYVLHAGAQLAIFAEDYTRARTYAEEALPLAQSSGDDGVLGSALVLASVGKRATDPAASAELGRQAVALLRGSGDRQDLAVAVAQLALTEALRDRFGTARGLCEELGPLLGGRPPSWLAVWIEMTLAWADLGQGEPRAALQHCERGLELEGGRSSLGHYSVLSYKLQAMVLLGEADRARAVGEAAMAQAERDGLGVAVSGLEHTMGLVALALDDLRCARDLAMRRFGDPHFAAAANAHELLARLELAEGRADPLHRHAAALRATGQHTGNPRLQALACWADGTAALLAGELTDGANRLDEALALQIEHRLRPGAIDTLEAIGEVQIARGRPGGGARLLGATERARSELELCRLPARRAHFQDLYERGRQAAGSQSWADALAEGRDLTLDAALDYARRGRGRHVTAQAGIESLTPAERSVANAAAEGLTNAAIAARLFMSHGTVKAHLGHAYQKLDVANRVELAALVREHHASV